MNAHISTSPDGAQGNTASPLGMGRSSHGVRSHSISSDRISLSGLSTPSHYLRNPTPDAAYIAPSTASHLVSTAQDEHWDSFLAGADDEDRRAAALVSVASLRLVNSFLDYILDCILVSAGSLSLSAVRPAVIKTLKPKLAEELLAVADHELEEYTGSMEEDELLPLASDALPGLEWDSESAWRVMRLRCMVYATLGEFEENDMEFFLDNQGLCLSEDQDAKMAIFLTAILEGVGEKVLRIAGQAAHRRGPVQRRQSSTSVISDQAGRLVVEELDTLKVASSPQLGRLWRGWRKTARSVTPSFSRPNLHGGAYRRSQRSSYTDGSRRSSIDSAGDYSEHRSHQGIDETLAQFSELEIAAKIPLPNEQDEEEIDGGNFAQMRSRSLVNPTSRSRSLTSPPHPERVTQHSRTSSLPAYKRIFDSVSAAVVSSIGVDRVHEKERAPIPSSKLSGGQAVRELISRARARGEVNNPQAFAREVGSDTGEDAETSRPDHSTETIRSHPRQSPRQVGSNAKHDNPLDASDRDFHDSEIVSFRKVSMEPARVPQIIETRSRASSKSKSHYSVDSTALSFDDDDQHDPHAIGVARTHNGISPPPSLRGAGGRLLLVDDGNPVSHGSSMKGSRYQADQATKNRGSTFVVPHAVEKRRRPEGLTIVERGDGGLRVLGGVPPPLTPLRELVEAAADTSDEASSVAPSQDAHSERDRSEEFLPYQRHSRGSDRFIKAQTDNLSNYPTRNESIPPASASAETEKSVIRPQPSSSKDARTVASNRSDSFGQTSRVSHSSGSGMAVAHRMSPTADSDSLPSEQTSLHGKNQSDDRGKNFEELIRRDETLKYTLTPHNVRSDSQPPQTPDLPSEDDRQPVVVPTARHNGHASHGSVARGVLNNLRPSSSLSSNVMLNSPSSASTVLITQRAKKYIPVSRPPPPSNRQSSSGLMAREARLESESIASFADWIRSTGPKSVTNRASHPADSRPMQAQSQASNRMSGIISPTGLRPIIYSAGTSTTDPRQRNRLQPRDARTISPSNAELIDAIRVGPPHVGARVDPDAEQMRRSAGSGVENGTTLSVASSLQSRSYAASNSSRTPLVAGTRRIQGQASFENGIQVGSSTRKADPYNLGLNDPDDAHTTFNKSSKRTEMSMMDFLKDGPSEGPQPSSSFDDIPPPSPERAPRRGATLGALGSDLQDIPRRSNSFRTGNRSKYSEPVFDKATFGYEAQQSAGNVRVPEGAPRAPPVASDIRSAQRAGQNELADFFRNSAPPEAPKAVQRPLPRKEGSGFGKMFGRKKAAAYT